MEDERPLSALPSPRARALAFIAIVLAGVCGAVIGWAVGGPLVGCQGDCGTAEGVGALVGGVGAAVGVAVVAVLTLRAMGEWKRVSEEELFDDQAGTIRRNPSA